MVLTKAELITSLRHEVHILIHLMSKIEPQMLEYRPTPQQRSLLELLRYLTLVGPIHLRTVLSDSFAMEDFKQLRSQGEATSKTLDFEQVKEAVAGLSGHFTDSLNDFPEARFREDFALFGRTVSRGSWLVALVLNHYVAYRTQVFLYLKGAGCDSLSTMNLWAGADV